MNTKLKCMWNVLRGRPTLYRAHVGHVELDTPNTVMRETRVDGDLCDGKGVGIRYRPPVPTRPLPREYRYGARPLPPRCVAWSGAERCILAMAHDENHVWGAAV